MGRVMRVWVGCGFWALFAVTFFSACTAAQAPLTTTPAVEITSTPPPPTWSIPGSEYFPADTVGIARVNVAELMATSYVQHIRDALSTAQLSADFEQKRQAVFELAERVDVITMSIGPNPDSPGRSRVGVAIIEGRFSLTQLLDGIRRINPEAEVLETQVAGLPAVQSGEASVVELEPGRLLLGFAADLGSRSSPAIGALRRAHRRPPRSDFMSDPSLETAYRHVDGAIIAMASDTSAMQDTLDQAFESTHNALGLGVLSTDSALVVRAILVTDSLDAARSVAASAREWRDEMLLTPSPLASLTDALRAMTVDTRAESATLETHLPEADVLSMIDMAMTMFMAFAQPPVPTTFAPISP